MGNGMPQLNRAVYAGVQRALKSLWYGNPSAIAEAADWMNREYYDMRRYGQNDSKAIETALAQYAGIILEALPIPSHPEQLKLLMTWHCEELVRRLLGENQRAAEQLHNIPAMRADVERMRREYLTVRDEVTGAAKRLDSQKRYLKALETRKARLEEQARIMAATVQELEQQLNVMAGEA